MSYYEATLSWLRDHWHELSPLRKRVFVIWLRIMKREEEHVGFSNNTLSKILKERRKAKGLTLRQVSVNSGVSTSHLGRIERGERFPSGHILQKLANPLGFTEVELLKEAGFMSRDDSDARVDTFKKEIKSEIAHALVTLYKKVDSF